MKKIKCREAEALILQDLDQGLNPTEKDCLENHLNGCSECARVGEEFRVILTVASSDVPQVPDEDFWIRYDSSLEARIREKELEKEPRWLWKLLGPLVAAAVIVVAVFALTTERYKSNPTQTVSASDVTIEEVDRLFGPSQAEFAPSSQGTGVSMVLNGVTEDALVRWFEVEDESNQLFL